MNKSGSDLQTDDSLHGFCRAFASRDAEGIAALFDPKGLCELPLIGQRLVGPCEIHEGFSRAFSLIDSCSIVPRSIRSGAGGTIAEGELQAKLHRDADPMVAGLAVVLIEEAGKTEEVRRIARLSIYLDAARFRAWSDGPIFGRAGSELEG